MTGFGPTQRGALVVARCLLSPAPRFCPRSQQHHRPPRTPARTRSRATFRKRCRSAPGQSFQIENKFGEVRIHGESGREVKISATIRVQASSREEAESYAQKVQIDVQQAGDGVRVRTIYPDEERQKWFHIGKNTSYSVELRHRRSFRRATPHQQQFRQRHHEWRARQIRHRQQPRFARRSAILAPRV